MIVQMTQFFEFLKKYLGHWVVLAVALEKFFPLAKSIIFHFSAILRLETAIQSFLLFIQQLINVEVSVREVLLETRKVFLQSLVHFKDLTTLSSHAFESIAPTANLQYFVVIHPAYHLAKNQ